MRVLVVHNDYSSRVPSGENLAVRDEVAWLRDAGVDVHLHTATNDDVVDVPVTTQVRQAAEAVWSLSARSAMRRALDEAQPDLVHVHNAFPLITASAPALALRRDLPVVWTVHNHRIVCVAGTHFRAGAECHLCTRANRLPGIRHACYGDSSAASALVTAASSAFGRLARRRFAAVAISGAVKDWLVGSAGFDPARVQVKYNGIAPLDTAPTAAATCRSFVFAGQVAEHKGVGLLLDAWRRAELPADAELRIIGDGPLAPAVRAAAGTDPRISWLGQLPADEVAKHMAEARAVVVPSIWQETFGRVAAEAMAASRPVVTSGTGGLAEVVADDAGWVTGTDPAVLAETLATVARADDDVARRARAAQQRYERLFSPEATTRALLDVYESALGLR